MRSRYVNGFKVSLYRVLISHRGRKRSNFAVCKTVRCHLQMKEIPGLRREEIRGPGCAVRTDRISSFAAEEFDPQETSHKLPGRKITGDNWLLVFKNVKVRRRWRAVLCWESWHHQQCRVRNLPLLPQRVLLEWLCPSWLRIYLQGRRQGFDPHWGRSPARGHGNPPQYSCLENPHGQRSLAGCGPRGRKRLRHDLATKQQHWGNWRDLSEVWRLQDSKLLFCGCAVVLSRMAL